ncbi:MAG: VCBS repeat-containing protein [Pseudomonadota bacterium]
MVMAATLAGGSASLAQDWQVRLVNGEVRALAPERCTRPRNGLPDGCVARGSGDVAAAWYTEPTTRYAHAILGDAIEAGTLTVRLSNGAQTSLALPPSEVFEDRIPYLADLDRDGRTEIITIRASARAGAAVTVYGVRGEALVELGTTRFIGTPNRWLNIAGIADYLGRGHLQIAFVETPHIGGTLKLATFGRSGLQVVAQARGFSNHEIRAREQRLSATADIDGDGRPDLAVPDARRERLRLVRFEADTVRDITSIALPAPVNRPVVAEGRGERLRFLTGLSSGQVVSVSR